MSTSSRQGMIAGFQNSHAHNNCKIQKSKTPDEFESSKIPITTLKPSLHCPSCTNKLDFCITEPSLDIHKDAAKCANSTVPSLFQANDCDGFRHSVKCSEVNSISRQATNKKSVWSQFNTPQQITVNQIQQDLSKIQNKPIAPEMTEHVAYPAFRTSNAKSEHCTKSGADLVEKYYGKSTIFRLPANSVVNNHNGQCTRSLSFTVIPPASINPNPHANATHETAMMTSITYPDSVNHISSFPFFQTGNLDKTIHASDPIGNGIESLQGLDSVEAASLYESSESSSQESLAHCSRQKTHSKFSPRSEKSFCSLGFSILNSDEEDKECSELSPNFPTAEAASSEIFDYDIPQFRQDLYKDSLTLLFERILGKFRKT